MSTYDDMMDTSSDNKGKGKAKDESKPIDHAEEEEEDSSSEEESGDAVVEGSKPDSYLNNFLSTKAPALVNTRVYKYPDPLTLFVFKKILSYWYRRRT
ncbi:hypothetical protein TWF696_009394 [Orbilia brochopaga]|uniref:Uncharacterized protein n=1 Tax=Orbilia brochopaga TaxID=3140254 RepID=A0AAV9UKI2_9PEZI